MRIIETDNFGRDYPDESFLPVGQILSTEAAEEIAYVINKHCSGPHSPRFWRVVPNDYVLSGGFEP